jgi:hypothetical protein
MANTMLFGDTPDCGSNPHSILRIHLSFHSTRILGILKQLGVFMKPVVSQIVVKLYSAVVNCNMFFFSILVCEAIGTAATPGLLCQPRVIVKMIVENQMECRLAGETEVLGENLPQRHFCPSQNPTWMTRPGFEPGPPRWEAIVPCYKWSR